MFLRILKKDLKRKKSMNIILLLFVVLASMFVASGLYNVISVWSGTEYYLNQAGIDDYVVITNGENCVGRLDDILNNEPAIKSYKFETVIYGSKDNVCAMDDSKLETKNALIFQKINDSSIKFFDKENKEITSVEEGHVYVSGNFMTKNDYVPGDKIKIKHSGVELVLELTGKAKDALLGSDFMGNTRFVMNEKDYQKLLNNEIIKNGYQGQIVYIKTDDTKAISSALATVKGVAFAGTRDIIKMCYVMEMIVAFVIVILSICLILVSFVVLKFSITYTISEEFREIGVMKAIGISNFKVRSLYIIKYLMLAIVGACIGLIASIPFSNFLMKTVSENMVLGNSIGTLINVMGVIAVVIIILLFAYGCTRKIKTLSPVDAVRSGQTGERYKKKFIHHIGRHRGDTALQLAFNDVITNPKRFVTIIISFFICTLFTLVLANVTNTMKSDKLITTFGAKSDIYYMNIDEFMHFVSQEGGIAAIDEKLNNIETKLKKEGMPCKVSVEVQYQCGVEYNGNKYALTCQQGRGAKATDYEYLEGEIPKTANEIAITPLITKLTGARIGDEMVIDFGKEKRTCIVTATYQTMNKLGEVIRLHEDAPVDISTIASMMAYQVNFTDRPSNDEILIRQERMKELYGCDEIYTATEYCILCVGVVDTMESVEYMLLGITLIVVLLVTILMERSFITEEKSQIAILKAIGFKDYQIIKWHVYRFGIVSLISVFLAALCSIPITKLCGNPLFGMMGARNIDYYIRVFEIFLLYPGIILIGTVMIAAFSALHTKQIKSSDTANIE